MRRHGTEFATSLIIPMRNSAIGLTGKQASLIPSRNVKRQLCEISGPANEAQLTRSGDFDWICPLLDRGTWFQTDGNFSDFPTLLGLDYHD